MSALTGGLGGATVAKSEVQSVLGFVVAVEEEMIANKLSPPEKGSRTDGREAKELDVQSVVVFVLVVFHVAFGAELFKISKGF